MAKPDLTLDSTWTGEFFVPGLFEARFVGSLSYSLSDGIVLAYRISDDTPLPETEVLHGILDSGEMCTLFGKFSTEGAGFSVREGLYSKHGRHHFRLIITGGHISADDEYDDSYFMPTGLQELFIPGISKVHARHSEHALLTATLPNASLELRTSSSFGIAPHDVTATYYSSDKSALADLASAFDAVRARHPEAFFMLKKELQYVLRLRFNKPAPPLQAVETVLQICDLFALLLDTPCFPKSIEIVVNTTEGKQVLGLYPALGLRKDTVTRALRSLSKGQLPLRPSDFDLSTLLVNWLNDPRRFSVLVAAIQHDVGFRTEHTTHGDIVLYSAQLESVSYTAGEKDRKYEFPLSRFGTSSITSILEETFGSVGVAGIGEAIADLRNEVAHLGKPRKLLLRLTLRDLMKVSRCLQLILVAHALETIGVNRTSVEKYLAARMPRR